MLGFVAEPSCDCDVLHRRLGADSDKIPEGVGPLLIFSIALCLDNMERFPNKTMPRWNFTDFMHSFMIVFRVLCGEWIGRQQTFSTSFTLLQIFLAALSACAPNLDFQF
jgi:hypothetical protein